MAGAETPAGLSARGIRRGVDVARVGSGVPRGVGGSLRLLIVVAEQRSIRDLGRQECDERATENEEHKTAHSENLARGAWASGELWTRQIPV